MFRVQILVLCLALFHHSAHAILGFKLFFFQVGKWGGFAAA